MAAVCAVDAEHSGMLPPAYECDCHEELPQYTCDVNFTGQFLLKQELDNPYTVAFHRRWRRAEVELRGTALLVKTRLRGRSSLHTRTYTLQAADAGIATDYSQRSHVLRIRAEGEQILLATSDPIAVLNWVERINAAIAVSLALDEREDPRFRMLPNTATPIDSAASRPSGLRRKFREGRWQSKDERQWLTRSHEYPEDQSPFLISLEGTSPIECDALSSESMSTLVKSVSASSANLESPSEDAPFSFEASAGTARALGPSRGESFSSSMLSLDDHDEAFFKDPLQPVDTTQSARTNVDYVRACTRLLKYSSGWKAGYYVRGEQFVKIRHSMTVANLTKLQRS